MSESKLERYARMHPSRTHTGKTQQGERPCAIWLNFPADEKNDHPGNRLYNFTTFDGKQIWLCRKCLIEFAAMDQFLNRHRVNKHQSIIPRISVADVEERKSYDVMLTIQQGSEIKETVRCEAWPTF